jgi:ubiquinone/menaquinone biosynthesis C-methylase UbiE
MRRWDKKRKIMRRYDATAQMYDVRYAQEQAAKIEAALKNVRLEQHCLVLDVGCGTGILFAYIADRAEAAVGVDISRKTLLKAKEHVKNVASAHLVWADADSMPIKTGVFDSVFAMTLIQNAPDPCETLNEINRVSKDDSAIVVTGLKKVFTKQAFERLLKNAGLRFTAFEEEGLQCYVAICDKAP